MPDREDTINSHRIRGPDFRPETVAATATPMGAHMQGCGKDADKAGGGGGGGGTAGVSAMATAGAATAAAKSVVELAANDKKKQAAPVALIPTDPTAALEAAEAALRDGDGARALRVADGVIRRQPLMATAWELRARALQRLRRHHDVLRMAGVMNAIAAAGQMEVHIAAAANETLDAAKDALGKLETALPAIVQKAERAEDDAARAKAREAAAALDPTSVYALFEAARVKGSHADTLQAGAARRSKGGRSAVAHRLAVEAYGALTQVSADVGAYTKAATTPAAPLTEEILQLAAAVAAGGAANGGSSSAAKAGTAASHALEAILEERHSNCPLPPSQCMAQFEAKLEMQLGVVCDTVHASRRRERGANDGEPSEAEGEEGEAEDEDDGELATAAAAVEHSLPHFERSAHLDGSSWSIFSLWHEAVMSSPKYEGQPQARKAALKAVHAHAVKQGVWGHPDQRPMNYLRGLTAQPWHEPQQHAACRALLKAYPTIKAEALQLLRVDAAEAASGSTSLFCAYMSTALLSGEWADVSLYYNGRRNEDGARRAPRTSALLGDDCTLRRDATSCPFGSAFFSLMRPGSRLAPHCGPTNRRLRAHLGLVVPEGDIRIRCGDEAEHPPRRWREGEVLLFDDSFEHEVWNLTDQPRLVLIVDIWHPQLDTDEKRLKAMASEHQQAIYRGVVHRRFYGSTKERGKFGEARRARAELAPSSQRARADVAPTSALSSQLARAEFAASSRRTCFVLGATRRLGAVLARRRRAHEAAVDDRRPVVDMARGKRLGAAIARDQAVDRGRGICVTCTRILGRARAGRRCERGGGDERRDGCPPEVGVVAPPREEAHRPPV